MTINKWIWTITLVITVLFSTIPRISRFTGGSNLYVLQADAFLHGRLDIDRLVREVSVVGDRYFVAHPPAPAMVLMPVVALVGKEAANTNVVGLLLSVLNVLLLLGILKRIEVEKRMHFWLVTAFFLGTGYWLAMMWANGIWFFAHIVATTFLFLAIFESLGKSRGWLVGLCLGIAFLSRQLTLFTSFFLVAAMWEKNLIVEKRLKLLNLLGFATSLSICVSIYLLLNYLRFKNPFDTGYSYMLISKTLTGFRAEKYGFFSPAYVPFNLVYLLLQGLHLNFQPPNLLTNMVPDKFGTSLFSASPFLILAFYANRSSRLVQAGWLTVSVTICIQLFYFNNGWLQLNTQRYALDYWPVLIVMIALGLKRQLRMGQDKLWQWFIGYAVMLNAFVLGLPVINRLLSLWVDLF